MHGVSKNISVEIKYIIERETALNLNRWSKLMSLAVLIIVIITLLFTSCTEKESSLKLWYDKPAKDWMTEALPIGNGYMGAMIFGSIPEEQIQFNEETLWSGGPGSHLEYNFGNRKNAHKYLAKIRSLLKKGKYDEAHRLANSELTGVIHKDNLPFSFGDYGAYQNFGSIYVKAGHDTLITDYVRELDIEKTAARVLKDS